MPKILPPIVFVMLLVIQILLLALFQQPAARVHQSGIPFFEAALAVAIGVVFLVGARFQFMRNDSEIMTFDAPRNLVTSGLFRISRNPMYLGFTLLLVAAALAVNLWWAFLAPAAFFLLASYWYIPFEEDAAADAFGADYENYRARTRRWF